MLKTIINNKVIVSIQKKGNWWFLDYLSEKLKNDKRINNFLKVINSIRDSLLKIIN